MKPALPLYPKLGSDGKLTAFSKTFSDDALAVETQLHIAESQFELFKSHKSLGRDAEAKADLESGRRVLRKVMEDFPNPKYVPRISYLLGQFSQGLKQWGPAPVFSPPWRLVMGLAVWQAGQKLNVSIARIRGWD